jgi:hypothetical protein
MVAGIVNNAENIMTAGSAVLKFKAIKYPRPEIPFCMKSLKEKITKIPV